MVDGDFAWQAGSIFPYWTLLVLSIVFAIGLAQCVKGKSVDKVGAWLGWIGVSCCGVTIPLSFVFPGPGGTQWVRLIVYCGPLLGLGAVLAVACVRKSYNWRLTAVACGMEACVVALIWAFALGQN